jgi:hypothetical protein
VETSAKRLGALGCLSLGFQERSLRLSLQATFFGAVGIIATEVRFTGGRLLPGGALQWRDISSRPVLRHRWDRQGLT